uniref:Uncharacterized protein n=1 Tax=Erpetoichthys calabaricus TaxID=27687 RepID=A0A8C4TEL2_ERPCA
MALSLSSTFLKVTKANVCFPKSLILLKQRRGNFMLWLRGY